MERLLAPDEVTELLQIPKTTLYRWKYERIGPPIVKVGRHLRYRPEDLQ
ncbi:MAG: helix-turn-helix domain-containing protein [Gemmatimonadales bacterium]|jgi:predicted site-specific integrase-resolvase|nr:helix-turn-helix domain-containing protein [Gemmatimonadales bacterium]MBT7694543.1 helix-turn-helix domain-containing protein [Gemmatimonadales bacterium]